MVVPIFYCKYLRVDINNKKETYIMALWSNSDADYVSIILYIIYF